MSSSWSSAYSSSEYSSPGEESPGDVPFPASGGIPHSDSGAVPLSSSGASSPGAAPLSVTPSPIRLEEKIRDLAHPLAPLVQITTGYVHPAFPTLLLNYWLLTSDQLDSLMEFYHQKGDHKFMCAYPMPVGWEEGMDLERKRRRFGRFIGLRGCTGRPTSPTFEPVLWEVDEQALWKGKGDSPWYR